MLADAFDGLVRLRTEGMTNVDVVQVGLSKRNRRFLWACLAALLFLATVKASLGLVQEDKPLQSLNWFLLWAMPLAAIFCYLSAKAWSRAVATARQLIAKGKADTCPALLCMLRVDGAPMAPASERGQRARPTRADRRSRMLQRKWSRLPRRSHRVDLRSGRREVMGRDVQAAESWLV
jgi:hypothetical protein